MKFSIFTRLIIIECPGGWISAGNNCFKVFNKSTSGWQQANDFCTALQPQRNSHLAVIVDRNKQQIIKQLFDTYSPGQK
jgi:hypothetical protein